MRACNKTLQQLFQCLLPLGWWKKSAQMLQFWTSLSVVDRILISQSGGLKKALSKKYRRMWYKIWTSPWDWKCCDFIFVFWFAHIACSATSHEAITQPCFVTPLPPMHRAETVFIKNQNLESHHRSWSSPCHYSVLLSFSMSGMLQHRCIKKKGKPTRVTVSKKSPSKS